MTTTRKSKPRLAEILREYGPYPGMDQIHGVTFDGAQVWFARGESIVALDPESGSLVRELAVAGDAGTAFDGEFLWQLADERIQKVDPRSGQVVATIPAPSHGRDSGLTWAEGMLWVGEYRARKIRQIDAETGAILRTIESDRFVTGVSWVNGELWHGTMEAEESELRRIDPETGKVLERLEMPADVTVSGLEADRRQRLLLRWRRQRQAARRAKAQTKTPINRKENVMTNVQDNTLTEATRLWLVTNGLLRARSCS
jgi:glutamine cyclotransferase